MKAPWLTGSTSRNLFFTGKGGVGKTSLACASALFLAKQGLKTLIVSTDPASNLDEVLGTALAGEPRPIPGVEGLFAMNIDPEAAAARYRERAVGPYRGVLPEATVRSMEESLSGACTTEIAAFDEFTALLGGQGVVSEFDRIVFDTAPTGHTLRLLSLPAAWTGFIESNTSGVSCLGPLAALEKQQAVYRASVDALRDAALTTVVLVARPDGPSLKEAARASRELSELGVSNQRLVVNGVFAAHDGSDPIAAAMAGRAQTALSELPEPLRSIPTDQVPFSPQNVVGIQAIRALLGDVPVAGPPEDLAPLHAPSLSDLVDALAREGRGVVMTMGKGGVGKTSLAAAIATELSRRGHPVLLSTTDPAAHVRDAVGDVASQLQVERIDPALEVERYTAQVMDQAGAELDAEGRALLEEDLRSPCTEEIAVFRAFADTVDKGRNGFVVLDTAPTGHTILLLDAAEAYHRDVLRATTEMPESVRELLPRLRDGAFTKVLIVTLPEPTPVHEALKLQADLGRAGIQPFAWVVNQSLAAAQPTDPLLRRKAASESRLVDEVRSQAPRFAVIPWVAEPRSLITTPAPEAIAR